MIHGTPRLAPGDCGDWHSGVQAQFSNRAESAEATFRGRYPIACGERDWYVALLDHPHYVLNLFARTWADVGGSFAGTVRDTNEGRSVTAIDYSAYTSMAEAELGGILAEAEDRFGVSAIVVEHRVGALAPGDVSIAIVAAHAHRAPALDCTRFVIDEVKKRVPVWKRERYADGTREWVDPTASGVATP